MQAWLETVGVALLVVAGALAGRALSRLPRPRWAVALSVPFVLILAIALARQSTTLSFVPPLSWVVAGRLEFVLLGPAVMMLLSMLLPRLAARRQRVLVGVFAAIAAANLSVLPFALAAVNQNYLLSLDTQVDSNGVCLQNTFYTCGPASAVTALGVLGVRAGEGELAVACHTTRISGTEPDLLCATLTSRYSDRGIACEYRRFQGIPELGPGEVMLALVKYSLFVDHYVTVLGVSDGAVVIGDPLEGRRTLTTPEFEKMWRFTGIVLKKR